MCLRVSERKRHWAARRQESTKGHAAPYRIEYNRGRPSSIVLDRDMSSKSTVQYIYFYERFNLEKSNPIQDKMESNRPQSRGLLFRCAPRIQHGMRSLCDPHATPQPLQPHGRRPRDVVRSIRSCGASEAVGQLHGPPRGTVRV